jgi:hypothetical protein
MSEQPKITVECCGHNCDAEIPANPFQSDCAFIDDEVMYACTPRCLYEGVRDYIEQTREDKIENDLLSIAALDMFDLIERLMNDAHDRQSYDFSLTDEEGNTLRDAWERLGHCLNQLDLDPAHRIYEERGEA